MTTNQNLQTRLAKYGLAAGAISSAAAADVVLIDDAPIAIAFGQSTINFADGCLNFDLNFVYSSFQTGWWNSFGSECCGYSTYYTTYGGGGTQFCTNYALVSTNSNQFNLFFSASCDVNALVADTGELGDDVEANIAGCNLFGNICNSSSFYSSDCGGQSGSSFSDCGEDRRFYVGFQTEISGRAIFGWMQIDSTGTTGLQITKWAYEDSGNPITFGEEPAPEPADCNADLNGDGTVDAADMGILLAKWGPCDP